MDTMYYISLLILYYLTCIYNSIHGIVHTTIHKRLLPFYYLSYQKPNYYYYYLNKKLDKYDYSLNGYLPSNQYYSYYPRSYSPVNYRIIPGVDKLKTIETETLKHVKEFTEITTEHKKSDSVLPSSTSYDFDENDINDENNQFEINKFIDNGADYNFESFAGNNQVTITPNSYLNETNNLNYQKTKQSDISLSSNQKRINSSDIPTSKHNNNSYSSKHVETRFNENFLYKRQIIKQRESLRYIALRPSRKKKSYW
ncbi:unnamed protein product [Schistosoma turkestanicum]|nr:unnamed protein product [Schistosoma turkestanicum]